MPSRTSPRLMAYKQSKPKQKPVGVSITALPKKDWPLKPQMPKNRFPMRTKRAQDMMKSWFGK